MEATQIKRALAVVRFHAKIAWRGFSRTLYGSAVAFLLVMAISGFVFLTNKAGWEAVFDFIYSCVTLAVALSSMYAMGGRKKKGG